MAAFSRTFVTVESFLHDDQIILLDLDLEE